MTKRRNRFSKKGKGKERGEKVSYRYKTVSLSNKKSVKVPMGELVKKRGSQQVPNLAS